MKKIVSLLVAAVLLMSGAAMAELSVVQTSYLPVELYDTVYAYFFAEVTNTGEENVCLEEGNVDILDAEGNAVASAFLYGSSPYTIAPGATAYVIAMEYLDDVASVEDIPNVNYTVIGGEPYSDAPQYVTVAGASCAIVETEWDETLCEVIVTVKNDGTETVYNPAVAYGLYDQDGALLFADATTLYSVGIPAGQCVEAVFTVDQGIVEAWTAGGRTPTAVNGLAYLE